MKRTTAGIIAVTSIVVMAFVLGRCSAPTAAATPVEIIVTEHVTYDTDAVTAQALADLHTFVQSTSTTTTALPAIASTRYRTAAGEDSAAESTAGIFTPTEAAFFACVRWRESRGNYEVVNSTGTFRGAYQWYQGGWDHYAAQAAPDYVGVPPNEAPPAIQDLVSVTAYRQVGASPWGGACS